MREKFCGNATRNHFLPKRINLMKYIQTLTPISKCLLVGGLYCSALSAAESTNDLFTMSIEELMQVEVASATLSNETLVNVPGSVAVFTEQEIKQLGLTRLDEVLNYVTGMQSAQSDRDARLNNVSSRGRSSSVGGREILILINGQRINTEYSGNNAFSMPLVPLSVVEKIEVIKGPGSSLYGSNAFLAVINVLTKQSTETQATIAGGNMGAIEASFNTGIQQGDFSVNFSAAIGKDDGDTYPNIINSYNPAELLTLEDQESHRELLLNFKYQNTQLKIIDTYQKTDGFFLQGSTGPGINRSITDSLFVTLNQHINWTDKAHSEIWLDYRNSKNELYIQGSPYGVFLDISEPPSDQPLIGNSPIYETAHGIRFHNFIQSQDNLRLSLGLEYRQSELDNDTSRTNFDYASCLTNTACLGLLLGLSDQTPQDLTLEYYQGEFRPAIQFVNATEREIFGAFAQAQWRVRDDTEITAGIRHDKYSDSGNNTSPRLSIVHNLNKTHTFKINYGEAYRAPQFNELGLINNTLVQGNLDLTAETVRSYDAIWLTNYPQITTSLTLFKHDIEDAIQVGVRDQVVKLVNSDSMQTTEGIEADLRYVPDNSNLSVHLGVTRIFSLAEDQYRESDTLAYIIANYNWDKWNFNLSANYQSDKQTQAFRSDTQKDDLSSFWLANGKISYQVSPQINSFISFKNLFDKEYRTPAVSNLANGGIPNRGRSWLAGAEFNF